MRGQLVLQNVLVAFLQLNAGERVLDVNVHWTRVLRGLGARQTQDHCVAIAKPETDRESGG